MKKLIIILSGLVLSGLFSDPVFPQKNPEDLTTKYNRAVEAYYNKDFNSSAEIFLGLAGLTDGGFLYYNLGNVYYKMGNWGLALQNYEKALLVIPRNADLKTNLNLARKKLVDRVESSFADYLIRTLYFWISILSFFEYRVFLVLLSVVFWGLVFFKYFRRKKGLKFFSTTFVMLCCVFIYLSLGYCLKIQAQGQGRFGIILLPEVDVKATYLEKDQPLFQLHEGTKVRVTDSQGFGEEKTWLKIRMPQGQTGWVPKDAVGVI